MQSAGVGWKRREVKGPAGHTVRAWALLGAESLKGATEASHGVILAEGDWISTTAEQRGYEFLSSGLMQLLRIWISKRERIKAPRSARIAARSASSVGES